MKLSNTLKLFLLIDRSFRNRLGRIGITNTQLQPIENIPQEYVPDRKRLNLSSRCLSVKQDLKLKPKKLVEELTFTLFNRLSALKVMEAHIFFLKSLHAEKFMENARSHTLHGSKKIRSTRRRGRRTNSFSNISLICCQRIFPCSV